MTAKTVFVGGGGTLDKGAVTTTTKTDWEKEFDKKFPARNDCSNHLKKHLPDCQGCVRIIVEEVDDVKAFIRSLLSHQCLEVEAQTIQQIRNFNFDELGEVLRGEIKCELDKQRQEILGQFQAIVEGCESHGTYDYDLIAEKVIDFLLNREKEEDK